ncbi:TIGR03067 domain-containing protein [Rhodopirellula sp.]|nr:TIGR03067 domain-containing protein [Rhodopirellula sp.]
MSQNSAFTLVAVALSIVLTNTADAQSSTSGNELKRMQGHWRITEMVENGYVVPEHQMRTSLPGGGLLEIIDYTLLFKSPVTGVKTAKSFRLDPSVYPKQIAILERDTVTGLGIYQFDKGKLVICVANPKSETPTDFTAHNNSGRSLMVMESFSIDEGNSGKLFLPPPPRTTSARPPAQATNFDIIEVKTPATNAAPTIIVNQAPSQTPAIAGNVAGRILTDAEVRAMLVGNWRMNDGQGLLDITLAPDGTFTSFRHNEAITTFHTVFVATPISSGSWRVQNGQLFLHVNSSYRADRVNTTAVFAVRSISSAGALLVDTLGRVAKVIKLP